MATDDLGVGRGRLAVGVAAERGHLAGDVDVVLDGDRHAQQRAIAAGAAARIGLTSLEQRALGNTARNAFKRGCAASIRRRHSSTSSREDSSPAAISSAWRAIPAKAMSDPSIDRPIY